MHQDPGLASALEAARGQMAAVAERCLMVQQQKEDDAADTEEGRHDDDAWQDVDDEEGGDGVKALAPHGGAESNDGQGFVSLFAMYDMPNVVLVDMGRVAEKLAGAGGEAELQLEGLAQLEGVRNRLRARRH